MTAAVTSTAKASEIFGKIDRRRTAKITHYVGARLKNVPIVVVFHYRPHGESVPFAVLVAIKSDVYTCVGVSLCAESDRFVLDRGVAIATHRLFARTERDGRCDRRIIPWTSSWHTAESYLAARFDTVREISIVDTRRYDRARDWFLRDVCAHLAIQPKPYCVDDGRHIV